MKAGQLAETEIQKTSLVSIISQEDFRREHGAAASWEDSETALMLFQKLKAAQLDKDLCERQHKRLKQDKDPEQTKRRTFLKLFTTSKMGLGIMDTGAGNRKAAQQAMRQLLIEKYNAAGPDPKRNIIWCPILKIWERASCTTAAHIFNFMHGQDTMDVIFGEQEEPELMTHHNGMMI